MSAVTEPPRDQAARLRAMVSSVYGPGVSLVTFAEKVGPAAGASAGATTHSVMRTPMPAPRRELTIPVVAITSGKGGVGKTSLAVNLSIALQNQRCRTCLLDADLGLANADVMCGLNPTTRLDSAVEATRPGERPRRSLEQIAVLAPGGFRLVPGAVGVARMANLSAGQRNLILDGLADLQQDTDVLLIDTGAGLSDGVLSFVTEADLAVVVATPEPTSIADAYAMIKCAVRVPDPPRIALVVNQCESEDEGLSVHARIAATCKKFLDLKVPLLGTVRRDVAVPNAVRARKPLLIGTPRASASRDVEVVAAQLAKALEVRANGPQVKRRGLFGWLRGQ